MCFTGCSKIERVEGLYRPLLPTIPDLPTVVERNLLGEMADLRNMRLSLIFAVPSYVSGNAHDILIVTRSTW